MNRILLPYVATGDYKLMKEGFMKTMHQFCPESIKIFDYISDDSIGGNYIPHYPWPINALMKFKFILDSINRNHFVDYVFYFNSNIKFVDEVPDSLFLTDKLIVSTNVGWDYLGHDPLKFTYNKPLDPKSATYIDGYYTYIASGMFGGPIDLMTKVCTECHEMISYDLAHNRIPVFHDETALNKWVHEHQDQVTILDNNWLMDETDRIKLGYPDAKILLRDSSRTQYEYKDKYHE